MKQSKRRPLILVTTDVEHKGREFGDFSLSLSVRYEQALFSADAIPWVVPSTNSPAVMRDIVSRCDGVMLTGGDDVAPELYDPEMSAPLKGLARVTPDEGQRDHRELLLINEALRAGKPILAVCRGHQILNVAFGGTLIPDLPTCHDCRIDHRQMEKRCEVVHDVTLTPDSLLAKITGKVSIGVNSTHHQAVGRLGAGLVASAMSSDGVVEAIEMEAGLAAKMPFLLGVQFHPERFDDRHPEHRAIFRSFVKACLSV
jgi:putative glutamine amidotransferase